MQSHKTQTCPELPAAPCERAIDRRARRHSPGDPSWSPLTLRGHATSKVSHPSGDCNDNLA